MRRNLQDVFSDVQSGEEIPVTIPVVDPAAGSNWAVSRHLKHSSPHKVRSPLVLTYFGLAGTGQRGSVNLEIESKEGQARDNARWLHCDC